jgi:hypothetical protein
MLFKNKIDFQGVGSATITSYILSTYQLIFVSDTGWYCHPISNSYVWDSTTKR